MEKKQNFPSHAGLSGKALIASLFIISGILLFARNVGWITYDLFSIVVSWHSLLIVLDRKSTRLNSSHSRKSRMPSSA